MCSQQPLYCYEGRGGPPTGQGNLLRSFQTSSSKFILFLMLFIPFHIQGH